MMDQLLVQARAKVNGSFSRHGRHDNRTHPRFFDKSQAAWRRFVVSNCTVMAAYRGGANSAVSDRLAECYEGELDHRIQFLRRITEQKEAFGS